MVDTDEEIVPEGEAEGSGETVKRLREKLAKAVAEKQEYLDGWQRARADFANFKKDETAQSVQKETRIKATIAEAIIPALDSFDLARKDKSFLDADANLKKGIDALYQGLIKSLQSIGIAQYVPLGEVFDPRRHEALREVQTEDESMEHTIESVFAAGYSVGDQVIRPAQVSVYAVTKN